MFILFRFLERNPPLGFNYSSLGIGLELKPTGGQLFRNRVGVKTSRRVALQEQGCSENAHQLIPDRWLRPFRLQESESCTPSEKNLHSIPPMSTTTDQYPFFLFSPKLLNVPSLASSPANSLRMTFLIQISQVSRLVIQLRLLFSVSRRRSALLKLTLSPLLSSF